MCKRVVSLYIEPVLQESHVQAKCIFGSNTKRDLPKFLASPIKNFSETTAAPFQNQNRIKLYDVPVGLITTTPSSFEALYCFICGRQKMAVARYQMICLVLGTGS